MIAQHVVSALILALLPQQPVGTDSTPVTQETPQVVPVEVLQETPQAKPTKPQLPKGLRERVADPFAELKAGVLPAGTTASAKERFERLIPRNAMGQALSTPLTSFDLDFEIISRGVRQQHNQGNVKVRFQEPAFVAFSVGKDKQMGYGPLGYWQVFPDGTRLLNGREYDSDRRRIGEVRSVAKNFLSLADPRRLRLTRVEVPAAAPTLLPAGLGEELEGLEWLVIESPDFDLAVSVADGSAMNADANKGPRLFRATLGLKGLEVRHALVQELTLPTSAKKATAPDPPKADTEKADTELSVNEEAAVDKAASEETDTDQTDTDKADTEQTDTMQAKPQDITPSDAPPSDAPPEAVKPGDSKVNEVQADAAQTEGQPTTPAKALVQKPKPTSQVLLSTSMWVTFKEPVTVGPASLPSNVFVYYPELARLPIQFGEKPRDEMYLLKGKLNPEMAPEVFNPPGL